MRMHYSAIAVAASLSLGNLVHAQQPPVSVPVQDLGKGHQLIGKLHVPLGTAVRVQGVVIEGPDKGFEGGPQLRVQRIDDRATQEDIRVLLSNSTGVVKPDETTKVQPEIGKSYELLGYESGGYVGHPPAAQGWVQTAPHYFRLEFEFLRGKEIETATFSPVEFKGRRALLQGLARDVNGTAVMDGGRWQVIVRPDATWSKEWLGKQVETLGMYNPAEAAGSAREARQFQLVDGTCRLSKLEDQVGQAVELRGQARSRNDMWWFEYRGTKLYVENLEQLPGWSRDNWARPIVIRGQLERARLPSLEQIGLKSNRDLADHWIVRKASWAASGPLLAPEVVDGE